MRVGLVVPVGPGHDGTGEPTRAAADAEEAGLDLLWLESEPTPASAPATALTVGTYLAVQTSTLRLAVVAPVGSHPILIAEQTAVADNVSGGRLLLVLGQHEAGAACLEETAELVLTALASRPFRFGGRQWNVPGLIAGNKVQERIAVTPKPAQIELPIWLVGEAAPRVGRALGLSHVTIAAEGPDAAAAAWSETDRVLLRAATRLRRPAIREVRCTADGDFDDVVLVHDLKREADLWGLDVALLRLAGSLSQSARRRAIRRIASLVRPYLEMDQIPTHVQEYWRRELTVPASE